MADDVPNQEDKKTKTEMQQLLAEGTETKWGKGKTMKIRKIEYEVTVSGERFAARIRIDDLNKFAQSHGFENCLEMIKLAEKYGLIEGDFLL